MGSQTLQPAERLTYTVRLLLNAAAAFVFNFINPFTEIYLKSEVGVQ
jgi:hypothetical protein